MTTIYVVGLGPGDINGLPLGAYRRLQSGLPVYLRTAVHPVVDELRAQGLQFVSFDDYYEQGERFEEVYQRMADTLLHLAATEGDLVYAVPGHPLMAEQSVQNLLEQSGDIHIDIGPGQSFFDPVCTVLQLDPIAGLTLLDGTMLTTDQLQPRHHLLIAQVYHPSVASDVKLTLMDVYPDNFPVTVIRAAGVANLERVERLPLYELDRVEWLDHLTTVYVPAADADIVQARDPWFVTDLVKRLRDPDGCPWDREQTHASLRPYVLEEAYEVAHAIDEDDPDALASELGDLLLQVLLHAQIASEDGDFTIRDIYAALANKLIRRHPHVFGDVRADNAADAESVWRAAKQTESATQGGGTQQATPVLADVKHAQPPWKLALSLQRAAASVGYDWTSLSEVVDKLREELTELQAEVSGADADAMAEEFGDFLFSAINLARWLDLDPEACLAHANTKFERRLLAVEQAIQQRGQRWEDLDAAALDAEWLKAKAVVEGAL
ncbi:MAG: nucleoside triphosphate pyrophosphohydrolase [Alicyclobacillus sp.]|nr:nucleoside triphosphate pyrophosphohydrolase [Alicyclobacillus sp.]